MNHTKKDRKGKVLRYNLDNMEQLKALIPNIRHQATLKLASDLSYEFVLRGTLSTRQWQVVGRIVNYSPLS